MDNSQLRRCLDCDYVLDHLPESRCPECGREFDPNNPATYSTERSIIILGSAEPSTLSSLETLRISERLGFPGDACAWTLIAIVGLTASSVGVYHGRTLGWSVPGLTLGAAVALRSLVALVSSNTRLRWAWIIPLLISLIQIAACGGVVYVLGPLKDASAP